MSVHSTRSRAAGPPITKAVRCAVYTRKSTEDGLAQEFNSLDAQREAGEAYVRSQASEGWTLLPDRFDDGGYTGGNADRPGLKRLLAEIEAGRVDCVVVYKVDRLSRSLLDFARMMAVFESKNVAFVSVTQQFNTGTSMGRLVLNVLLSFAQFEREIISERTRDKIAATRRKGKWAGEHPVLGYDVGPIGNRLVVNEGEAEEVRTIFALYEKHRALLPVVHALAERGWVGKRWTTRSGEPRGGRPYDRPTVYRLLTNVLYAGKVRYKAETHPGEQIAIVEPAQFERVQALLRRNGRTGGAGQRNPDPALLRGLIRCAACNAAMTPTYTTRRESRRYRYYACTAGQRNGRATCPSKSVPAGPIERFVIERIRCLGRDPDLMRRVMGEVRAAESARAAERKAEHTRHAADLRIWHAEVRRVALAGGYDAASRLADLHGRIAVAEARCRDLEATEPSETIPEAEAVEALGRFDPVWETLTPLERARIVRLLVAGVEYDGSDGRLTVAFHPTGLRTLAAELRTEEVGA